MPTQCVQVTHMQLIQYSNSNFIYLIQFIHSTTMKCYFQHSIAQKQQWDTDAPGLDRIRQEIIHRNLTLGGGGNICPKVQMCSSMCK